MSRQEGIEMVKKYDSVKPRDLKRWLNYVGMKEEFDEICDQFRDQRVWSIQDGKWYKDNVWGGKSSYGEVKSYPKWNLECKMLENLNLKLIIWKCNILENTDTIAIIIARGGSKGIPRKNLADIAGKPLISYTIQKALEASNSHPMDVLVSTEDMEIKSTAELYGYGAHFYAQKNLPRIMFPLTQ